MQPFKTKGIGWLNLLLCVYWSSNNPVPETTSSNLYLRVRLMIGRSLSSMYEGVTWMYCEVLLGSFWLETYVEAIGNADAVWYARNMRQRLSTVEEA